MDLSTLIEKIVGDFGDKKRWSQYEDRRQHLPPAHRTALEGVERYMTYQGGITNGEVLMNMLEDLANLFERGAADGTSVAAIVGEDPVGFAEYFLRSYSEGQWVDKERVRLSETIDRARAQEAS